MAKDLKVRYKGTVLGYLWSILQPLALMLIFTFIFKEIFKTSTPQFHLFLLSALFPWTWFASAITGAATSFVDNANLIKKVRFPRLLPRYLKEKRRVEFWALKDVSLQVRRGECVGIIGANGSGKSTLLGLVAGVLRPSRGRVVVRERVAPLLELGLGFHPDLTGREDVLLNGVLLGLTRQQVRERFGDIVAFAEIGNFIDQPMRTYSSGMFMRLAFAVAVHVDADVLLLDEVLAVGDERFQEKCLDRLQAEICSGKTVLFVSHNMHTVRQFCTRAMLLGHGEKLAEGHPSEVSDIYVRG